MPAPPPHPPALNTQHALLLTFSDFLTVAIHTILYTRSLYPESTFITTRKYNLPVHQNRHPLVCQWINNSVAHVHKQLETNVVRRIVFVIFSKEGKVLERFLFDVERFPVVERANRWTEFEERVVDVKGKGKEVEGIGNISGNTNLSNMASGRELEGDRGSSSGHTKPLNIIDIEEQLRATIRKLDYEGSKKSPLPKDCTYTIAVELREDPAAMPPTGHPQHWIPSEPSLQTGERGNSQAIGSALGGVRSTPVRLVESGEFILETWIEEGEAKLASQSNSENA